MSGYFAYLASCEYFKGDPDFYGLLMAAMRKADTHNAALLRAAFPDVWNELQARYLAPGGVLDTDPEPLRQRVLGGAS